MRLVVRTAKVRHPGASSGLPKPLAGDATAARLGGRPSPPPAATRTEPPPPHDHGALRGAHEVQPLASSGCGVVAVVVVVVAPEAPGK